MKKLSILAISLVTLGSASAIAQTSATPEQAKTTAVAAAPTTAEEDKTPVKVEQLPEGIQKALKADSYKEWTATSASVVKSKVDYYEVTLTKGTETKTIKFDQSGTILQ